METNLSQIVQDAIEKAMKERGEVNILVAGKTGVGKSTLINAVFQGNYAKTGHGEPVTQETRKITKEGIPLAIYDTRGLELRDFKATFSELEQIVKELKNDKNPNNHIHAAWICIDENSRRVEQAEKELCSLLANHMPVIGVITKCISDSGFRVEVQRLLPQCKNVVRTNSISRTLDDGHVLEPTGLEDLVELTMEIVPEGQRKALAAAQKVSIKQKVNKAHGVVAASAVAAGGAAAVPIPFSDAVALVPIQVGMLAGITAVFGLDLKRAFLATLVSSTLTGAGATLAGRTIVSNLLKFIPGVGSVAGGAIAATTAVTMTTAFGEAYVGALSYLSKEKEISEIKNEDILAAFKSRLDFNKKKNNNDDEDDNLIVA